MASKPKYKDAKTEYVRTPDKGIGLRTLAKKWDTTLGAIGAISTRDGWVSCREQFWNKVDRNAEERSSAVHGDKKSQIDAKIAESLVMCGDLIHKCLKALNKPLTNEKNFVGFKSADLILKSVKSATESINNLDDRVKEIYGSGASTEPTPEQFAEALDALALSSSAESPYPRPEA